ncbi:hypothetical protein CVT24_008675 [Panaeolus cyanescens]|uniref:Uncharacterized protein n=1 Tax=Panaeolus cyanescens TaxID=181874 RepID=A0A409WEH9_9AGAR|nr:hypothetical protein CVT24_008675 [Panaeolus cyanescens]
MVVVDWKLANGHSETLPRYLFPQRYGSLFEDLILLPNRQLLCKCTGRWDILSWNDMTPTADPDNSSALILANADLSPSTLINPPKLGKLWPPFIWNGVASFVVNMPYSNGIHCFSFRLPNPANSSTSSNITTTYIPEVTSADCYFHFTPHRAILRVADSKLLTGTYNPDFMKTGYTHMNWFQWDGILPSIPIYHMLLDEISCRCILIGHLDQHYLVDFN